MKIQTQSSQLDHIIDITYKKSKTIGAHLVKKSTAKLSRSSSDDTLQRDDDQSISDFSNNTPIPEKPSPVTNQLTGRLSAAIRKSVVGIGSSLLGASLSLREPIKEMKPESEADELLIIESPVRPNHY